jgi:hypothetical protein
MKAWPTFRMWRPACRELGPILGSMLSILSVKHGVHKLKQLCGAGVLLMCCYQWAICHLLMRWLLCTPRGKSEMEHREHSSEPLSVYQNRADARCDFIVSKKQPAV